MFERTAGTTRGGNQPRHDEEGCRTPTFNQQRQGIGQTRAETVVKGQAQITTVERGAVGDQAYSLIETDEFAILPHLVEMAGEAAPFVVENVVVKRKAQPIA